MTSPQIQVSSYTLLYLAPVYAQLLAGDFGARRGLVTHLTTGHVLQKVHVPCCHGYAFVPLAMSFKTHPPSGCLAVTQSCFMHLCRWGCRDGGP